MILSYKGFAGGVKYLSFLGNKKTTQNTAFHTTSLLSVSQKGYLDRHAYVFLPLNLVSILLASLLKSDPESNWWWCTFSSPAFEQKFPCVLEIVQFPWYNFFLPSSCFLFWSTDTRHLERSVAKQGCGDQDTVSSYSGEETGKVGEGRAEWEGRERLWDS